MNKVAVTIELAPEALAELDRLAVRMQQPRADVAANGVLDYVTRENAFHDALAEAEAEFDRGDFITHDELVGQIRARGRKAAA